MAFLLACNRQPVPAYMTSLDSLEDFLQLADNDAPNASIRSVKVLLDLHTDSMYFIDSDIFPSHYEFANRYLEHTENKYDFFVGQYGEDSVRHLHMVNLSWFVEKNLFLFEFGPYDLADCAAVSKVYDRLMETTFIGYRLAFYPNVSKWEDCERIPWISPQTISFLYPYMAYNTGEAYGYLRIFDDGEKDPQADPTDIIVLTRLPFDIPLVAGIISSAPQNSLSHINVLSRNRGTPNVYIRYASENSDLQQMEGKLVHLVARANSYILEPASEIDARAFWKKWQPEDQWQLSSDHSVQRLLNPSETDLCSVSAVGGKAANFSILHDMGTVPLPEGAIIIPVYYYYEHLEKNGLLPELKAILDDPLLKTDPSYRKRRLKDLRTAIMEAPVDLKLLHAIDSALHHFSDYPSYRFRSSTNAEDLDFFSGAGLYKSRSAHAEEGKAGIADAITAVWASLWSDRAYVERDFFGIDQHTVEMAILVHRSFPREEANGVLITRNPYNVNPGYQVEVHFGGTGVVRSFDDGPDEVIIYPIDLVRNRYTIEYRSKSDFGRMRSSVMSDNELAALADQARNIQERFVEVYQPDDPSAFAVDIEFKIDEVDGIRRLYIKQARPFPAGR